MTAAISFAAPADVVPYGSQEELVEAAIRTVHARAHAAAVHVDLFARADPLSSAWPNGLIAAEAEIETRLACTAQVSAVTRTRVILDRA